MCKARPEVRWGRSSRSHSKQANAHASVRFELDLQFTHGGVVREFRLEWPRLKSHTVFFRTYCKRWCLLTASFSVFPSTFSWPDGNDSNMMALMLASCQASQHASAIVQLPLHHQYVIQRDGKVSIIPRHWQSMHTCSNLCGINLWWSLSLCFSHCFLLQVAVCDDHKRWRSDSQLRLSVIPSLIVLFFACNWRESSVSGATVHDRQGRLLPGHTEVVWCQ